MPEATEVLLTEVVCTPVSVVLPAMTASVQVVRSSARVVEASLPFRTSGQHEITSMTGCLIPQYRFLSPLLHPQHLMTKTVDCRSIGPPLKSRIFKRDPNCPLSQQYATEVLRCLSQLRESFAKLQLGDRVMVIVPDTVSTFPTCMHLHSAA